MADTWEKLPEKDSNVLLKETRNYFLSLMERNELRAWFLRIGDQIVASGAYVIFNRAPVSIKMLKGEAYLFNIFTLPEFRGKGYATSLTRHIVAQAKKDKCSRIWLRATEKGEPLYKKLGFENSPNVMELKP